MQVRMVIIPFIFLFSGAFYSAGQNDPDFTSFVAKAGKIKMFWKNEGRIINSFDELKKIEPGLVFAMNGGMFTERYEPVGLYVENGKQWMPVKKYNNPGVNFGMQPQGIFLIRNAKAEIIAVKDYDSAGVTYATQSAPLLVIHSKMNPLIGTSKNYLRNGVGLLPDGRILMAVSKTVKTFKQFAQFFLDNHCTTALYLDGAISEAYDGKGGSYGRFAVIIGVIK